MPPYWNNSNYYYAYFQLFTNIITIINYSHYYCYSNYDSNYNYQYHLSIIMKNLFPTWIRHGRKGLSAFQPGVGSLHMLRSRIVSYSCLEKESSHGPKLLDRNGRRKNCCEMAGQCLRKWMPLRILST